MTLLKKFCDITVRIGLVLTVVSIYSSKWQHTRAMSLLCILEAEQEQEPVANELAVCVSLPDPM